MDNAGNEILRFGTYGNIDDWKALEGRWARPRLFRCPGPARWTQPTATSTWPIMPMWGYYDCEKPSRRRRRRRRDNEDEEYPPTAIWEALKPHDHPAAGIRFPISDRQEHIYPRNKNSRNTTG